MKSVSVRLLLLSTLIAVCLEPHQVLAYSPKVAVREVAVAGFPFSDGFESASLDPNSWIDVKSGNGLVETNADNPRTGSRNLFLGQKIGGGASADLVLSMDLSGQTDVFLDFWWRAVGYTGNGNDGVYISDDLGGHWKQVLQLLNSPQTYRREVVNIVAATSANGVTLNDKFRIKLHYETSHSNGGAYLLDDLQLTRRSQLITLHPFHDDFESGALQQGFVPQITSNGLVQNNTDNPRTGLKNLFLGQKTNGGLATADLILVVDLSGQTDVFLDFWWRGVGYTGNGNDGVYISDDDGQHWKQVLQLLGSPQTYRREIVNIVTAASANGVALNEKFRIKFHYQTSHSDGGAYLLDDLQLTQRLQLTAPFPFQDDFESNEFTRGFTPQVTYNGLVQSNIDNPRTGSRNLFLGEKTAGGANPVQADLSLAIDLSGQTAVFMDFWWYAIGYTGNGLDGVYISDDDGVHWKQALKFLSKPPTYRREVINIATVASINGMNLNNRFRIKLHYQPSHSNGGAYLLDDLKITASDPSGNKKVWLPISIRQ